MSEPLTEKTLKRWEKYSAYSAQVQAAAEIRKLRDDKQMLVDNDEGREAHNAELIAENAKLRKALEPIEFCAEARGDHWCPSCRGNKQEGTPTRGHYAHCPIYLALKDPK